MASLPANRPTASVYVAEPVRRRSAFPLALAITSCSALAFGRVSVGYRASHIRVRGKKAPVSFWYPATPGRVSKELPYRHFISVAKIVEVLQGTELPGIGWEFRLRAGKPIYPEAQPIPVERQETELQERRLAEGLPRESCAIIFAHGYLGSRFDMLHLCEELAQCGFVVAAPDFAESLSGKVPLREVTRQDIMEELLTRLQKEFAVKHFGIVGHSAGGGTASLFPGPFQCGRVAIAGLAPQTVPTDPLLVVASEGDGVVALPRITAALPKNIELQDMDQFDAARPAIAILLRENGTRPPCHISFLSEESNKAMISLLTPLLPVARALKVPVLDFDVYLELQDSSRVAKVLLPKIEDFLCFHASKAK